MRRRESDEEISVQGTRSKRDTSMLQVSRVTDPRREEEGTGSGSEKEGKMGSVAEIICMCKGKSAG